MMAKITGITLFEFLAITRKRKGMTISALAAASGLHRNHISKIEAGKASPTLNAITKICEALDVEMNFVPKAEANNGR
jgi:transcriptional regulator with XRE-family HTH domain